MIDGELYVKHRLGGVCTVTTTKKIATLHDGFAIEDATPPLLQARY